MIAHGRNIVELAPEKRFNYLSARWKNMKQRIARKSRETARALGIGLGKQPTVQQMLDEVREVAEFALTRYLPKPYSGRVSLYRASVQPHDWPTCSFEDPYNGWRPLVKGELSLTVLPCGHLEVFDEPSLGLLAEGIAGQLPD
jgi:thioesterase domain-containing protein